MITRIITALVLAPVVIALILILEAQHFAEALLLVLVLGLFEWDHLTTRSNQRFVLSALTLLAVAVLLYLFSSQLISNPLPDLLPWLAVCGALFWVAQITTLSKGIDHKRSLTAEMGYGLLVMLCAWAALVWLRLSGENGARIVLVAMAVVWAADTFAYFAGVKWGRRKLAPSISPGKSIEGVVGGLLGALITAWIGAVVLLDLKGWHIAAWLVAALCAAAISVVGDLYVSRLKRQKGVKDSGKILPGHGGILDRIDGLLAAMPMFASCWWVMR